MSVLPPRRMNTNMTLIQGRGCVYWQLYPIPSPCVCVSTKPGQRRCVCKVGQSVTGEAERPLNTPAILVPSTVTKTGPLSSTPPGSTTCSASITRVSIVRRTRKKGGGATNAHRRLRSLVLRQRDTPPFLVLPSRCHTIDNRTYRNRRFYYV